jgi:hypothetical protein
VAERARAVARGLECAHETQAHATAVRVRCCQPPPPACGVGELRARHARFRQGLKRGREALSETRPLRLQPALELLAVGEVKAIEQLPGEKLDRALERPLIDKPLEGPDVAFDGVRV